MLWSTRFNLSQTVEYLEGSFVVSPSLTGDCRSLEPLYKYLIAQHCRSEHRGQMVSTSTSYMGGSGLKSRPGDRLS
jgi:hypothetical protein